MSCLMLPADSVASGPQPRRRRAYRAGRGAVYQHFTLRTPRNMTKRATCNMCGWDRAAVFARLQTHLATMHAAVVRIGDVEPGNVTTPPRAEGDTGEGACWSGEHTCPSPRAQPAPVPPQQAASPGCRDVRRCCADEHAITDATAEERGTLRHPHSRAEHSPNILDGSAQQPATALSAPCARGASGAAQSVVASAVAAASGRKRKRQPDSGVAESSRAAAATRRGPTARSTLDLVSQLTQVYMPHRAVRRGQCGRKHNNKPNKGQRPMSQRELFSAVLRGAL